MSNNLTKTNPSYSWLKTIHKKNFKNNSIALIGTGLMANQYALAINEMNIKNVQIISKSKHKGEKFCKQFGFKHLLYGGYKNNIKNLDNPDLVIVSLPIPLLLDATQELLKNNFTNILIEKPGSLYHNELLKLSKKITNQNIRIGYNRLLYPSFLKLKSILSDEEITSCTFNFTEWVHKIIFDKYASDVYQRWGTSNSLHLISMAFELIGMPKTITSYQYGKLDWHKSGSIFVGSGVSKLQIPFSYHADWKSAGRWNIEIMTKKGKYRLSPLEELYFCRLGETIWRKITLTTPFPKSKAGISEEIATMLSNDKNVKKYLPSLTEAALYNKITSKIFGYE
jgi:predicted dehydrogenase